MFLAGSTSRDATIDGSTSLLFLLVAIMMK
jgi:hypothetical protein